MNRSDIEKIKRVADVMADAARSAILPHFRAQGLAAENKLTDGFDPVTVADRAAERAMRDVLEREFPQDGILGEEYGAREGSSGLTWVLDPIDGTRGFISGTPTWGVLIALSDATGPLYGVIDFSNPMACMLGRNGHRVSQCRDLIVLCMPNSWLKSQMNLKNDVR